MKLLLLTSDNLSTAEVVAQALQVRFKLQSQGSPFIVLRSVISSPVEMIPPNVAPFMIEAEFKQVARTHNLFNKLVHRASSGLDFEAASKDIIGALPVSIINAHEIKQRLESHGFTVVSASINYQNATADKALITSRSEQGADIDDDNRFDFTVTGKSINFVLNEVGSIACDHFNVGLSHIEQIDKAFDTNNAPSSPIAAIAKISQATALRAAMSASTGKTSLSMKTEFVDEYITELAAEGVNSFDELPYHSQRRMIERAYIFRVIGSYDMANFLRSDGATQSTLPEHFTKLTSYADRLNINAAKLADVKTIPDLLIVTGRIDSLISDGRFIAGQERYNLLPKTMELMITEKAEHIMSLNGKLPGNDISLTVPYNPNFPASHCLNKVVSGFTPDEANTNVHQSTINNTFGMRV